MRPMSCPAASALRKREYTAYGSRKPSGEARSLTLGNVSGAGCCITPPGCSSDSACTSDSFSQLSLPLARSCHAALLDRTIAANPLGHSGDFSGRSQLVRTEAAKQRVQGGFIFRDQLALQTALGAVSEEVEGRAAQELQRREQVKARHQPRAITALRRLACSRGWPAQSGNRQME